MLKFFKIPGPDDRTLYEVIERIWIHNRNILWLYEYKILIVSVIFMETTWSAIRCCHSFKLSECNELWAERCSGETSPELLLIILTLRSYFLLYRATNAVRQHSASALKRLKTSLRVYVARKIESLHHYPRSQGNDSTNWTWQILEIGLFEH